MSPAGSRPITRKAGCFARMAKKGYVIEKTEFSYSRYNGVIPTALGKSGLQVCINSFLVQSFEAIFDNKLKLLLVG